MSKNSKTVVEKPAKKVAAKKTETKVAAKAAAKTVKAPAKKALPKAEKPAKAPAKVVKAAKVEAVRRRLPACNNSLCCWNVQQLDCRCRHAQEGQEDRPLGCEDFPCSG